MVDMPCKGYSQAANECSLACGKNIYYLSAIWGTFQYQTVGFARNPGGQPSAAACPENGQILYNFRNVFRKY
jgi:hypothetical protein